MENKQDTQVIHRQTEGKENINLMDLFWRLT
jgi:hypothetical protein